MPLSNFHFLRFAQKGHFQGVKFFLTDGQTDRQTDGPTNLLIEAPFPELKNTNKKEIGTANYKCIIYPFSRAFYSPC